MNNVENISSESKSFGEFFRKYTDYFCRVLGKIDPRQVAVLVATIEETSAKGKSVFLCGNGGSAAMASHYTIDLLNVNRDRPGKKPIKALSLSDNLSVVTALGNDHGYDQVFVKQLERYLTPGDVVIAISSSGNSPNVLNAVRFANREGATSVGIVGFDGGELKKLCKVCIHIETPKGEYGPVEDATMFLDHLITTYLAQK